MSLMFYGTGQVQAQVNNVEPVAMASFMGKEGNGTIILAKVHQAVGLLAKPIDEKSEASYTIESFQVSIGSNSKAGMSFETMQNYSAKLSEASLELLKSVKVGDVVMISKVLVTENGSEKKTSAEGTNLRVTER